MKGLSIQLSGREGARWLLVIAAFFFYSLQLSFGFTLGYHDYFGLGTSLYVAVSLVFTAILIFLFRPPLSIGRQGWNYWLKFFLVFLVGAVFLLNVFHLAGYSLKIGGSSSYHPLEMYSFLFGPIEEEILFRGLLCALLARRFGWTIAILISGTFFGLMHFVPDFRFEGFWLLPFFCGYFCGWLFYRSGTLLLPILAHIGGNAIMISVFSYPVILDWLVVAS